MVRHAGRRGRHPDEPAGLPQRAGQVVRRPLPGRVRRGRRPARRPTLLDLLHGRALQPGLRLLPLRAPQHDAAQVPSHRGGADAGLGRAHRRRQAHRPRGVRLPPLPELDDRVCAAGGGAGLPDRAVHRSLAQPRGRGRPACADVDRAGPLALRHDGAGACASSRRSWPPCPSSSEPRPSRASPSSSACGPAPPGVSWSWKRDDAGGAVRSVDEKHLERPGGQPARRRRAARGRHHGRQRQHHPGQVLRCGRSGLVRALGLGLLDPAGRCVLTNDHFTTTEAITGPVGDMRMLPDTRRVVQLAATPEWAWAPMDLYDQEGEPLAYCPRGFLKRMIAQAARARLRGRMAYEFEWFLGVALAPTARWSRCIAGPATAPTPGRSRTGSRRDLLDALAAQGVRVAQLHPEYSDGQMEVSLGVADPLTAADWHVLFRHTVRTHQRTARLPLVVLAHHRAGAGQRLLTCTSASTTRRARASSAAATGSSSSPPPARPSLRACSPS